MHLGLPDLGFMDLTQVVDHTMAIRGVVDLPLVVDADTGFGNALNVCSRGQDTGACRCERHSWSTKSKPPSMRVARTW